MATWYLSGARAGSNEIEPDAGRRRDLFMRILAIARDQFYVIGTTLPGGYYNVVQNNFHNVPSTIPEAWLYPDPGPTRAEQHYVSDV